jgi:predicted Rossmann fold flavoprotein
MALNETKWREFSGVALRDIELQAYQEDRELITWQGDMLFTHQGISGPCSLGLSREVAEALEQGEVDLRVDLKPGFTSDELIKALFRDTKGRAQQAANVVAAEFIPKRLASILLANANISESTRLANLSPTLITRLVEAVKSFPLGTVAEVILDKGEVVAGGIDLNEVDPNSMRSKKCKGLWCCGEVLDIAGPVGGYNLQAAFSTGYVAGEDAAGC